MRVLLSGLVLLSTVLAATGRAQEPRSGPAAAAAPKTDAEGLRERAAAFWAARVARDYQGQWELLEPRGRGRMTPGEYASGRGAVQYLAYQVEDATVKGAFGTVKVRVLILPSLPPSVRAPAVPRAAVLDDGWVRIGGVWYRRLEQDEKTEPQPRDR